MNYHELKGDLFSIYERNKEKNVYLAHCISSDFALGAGIAVTFNQEFGIKRKLLKQYPNTYTNEYDALPPMQKGSCILTDNVFNLITKRYYYDKPTYKNFTNALIAMRDLAIKNQVKIILMPKIGCGLDKLDYKKTKQLIHNVFYQTDIVIITCINE